MDEVYRDLPIDARKKQFRVATILAESTNERLKCRLRAVSLLQIQAGYDRHLASEKCDPAKPSSLLKTWTGSEGDTTYPPDQKYHRFVWGDFAALSYFWGDPRNRSVIEVNGVKTHITETLAAALRCLRSGGRFADTFGLWVDALCINQKDDIERGQQVALMREYYSTAWSVLCFLGPSYEQSDLALSLIGQLFDIADDPGKREGLRDYIVKASKHPHTPGSWLALGKWLRRPYWTRLWIMQEIALGANRAVLFTGTSQIHWLVFCRAVELLHGSLWNAKCIAIEHDCLLASEDPHLGEFDTALYKIQRDMWMLSSFAELGSGAPGLGTLLVMSRYSDCSDPLDRVYGMLGVMDSDVARLIEPDYTVDAAEAFTRAAEAHLSAHRNLEFLRESNLWGESGAPTWVPDWTWTGRQRDSRPDDTALPKERITAYLERRAYSADRGLSFRMPVSEGRRLQCTVALFDQIDGLGTNSLAGRHQPDLLQSRGSYSAYGNFEATARHFHIALYADRRRFVGDSVCLFNLPQTLEQAQAQFSSLGWASFAEDRCYHWWIDWCKCNATLRIGGVQLRDYMSGSIPLDADQEDYTTAYRGWVRTAIAGNRRLFTTVAGRFGWLACPNSAELEGEAQTLRSDVLAVLPGCSVPICLRRTNEKDVFRVFGESYAHGMMEGEMQNLLESGDLCLQDVWLE